MTSGIRNVLRQAQIEVTAPLEQWPALKVLPGVEWEAPGLRETIPGAMSAVGFATPEALQALLEQHVTVTVLLTADDLEAKLQQAEEQTSVGLGLRVLDVRGDLVHLRDLVAVPDLVLLYHTAAPSKQAPEDESKTALVWQVTCLATHRSMKYLEAMDVEIESIVSSDEMNTHRDRFFGEEEFIEDE
ncbi:MAG: hypothetical protein GY952_07035 [Rhodobacteraceae bacterium]|nr:hypothetical protein [Paracoccaceae bacterium]